VWQDQLHLSQNHDETKRMLKAIRRAAREAEAAGGQKYRAAA